MANINMEKQLKHLGTVGVQIWNKQKWVEEGKAAIKGIPWHFIFFKLHKVFVPI